MRWPAGFLIFIAGIVSAFAQPAGPETGMEKNTHKVSFIIKFDRSAATKDGYYLNGYVVNISRRQAQKFDGKTISIKGRVTIVAGLGSQPKEYDTHGNEIIKQGRNEDTKYILSPRIRLIK